MSSFVGQRLHDSASLPGDYIKVPTAASSPIRDDRALGANQAMVAHNNLSHLAHENVRHLAWWQHNATLSQTNGWSGLRDAAAPDSTQLQGVEWEISWSRAVAVHFGPFLGVQDRISATRQAPVLRRVAVDVDATAGIASSLAIYVALVAGMSPEPPWAAGPLVVSKTVITTGVTTINADADAALGIAEAVPCRPNSATAGALAYPVWYWVWVGWKSTNSGDRVKSISVYEQRN